MADIIHHWDIEALTAMNGELKKIRDALDENKALLVSAGFELMVGLQGRAGQKMAFVNVTRLSELEALIKKYDSLIQQLNDIISRCYIPCENEIRSKVASLLTNI